MTTSSDNQNQNRSEESTPTPARLTDEQLAERIAWLNREFEEATSETQQSLLAFEEAALREKRGDEGGAARDYLASYNKVPDFREPVEALLVLLERRKSFKNMTRLLDAVVRGAVTPEQSARAHLMRGMHALEFRQDLDAAREAFEEAVDNSPDLAAGWLELEMIAARNDDPDLRIRALEERVRLAAPAEWKFLLLLDLAKALHEQGMIDSAVERLREAATIESPFVFETWKVLEQMARSSERYDLLAEAFEKQAAMILDAMQSDGQGGKVPQYAKTPARVAELYLQAAAARAKNEELESAAELLRKAEENLPNDPLILYARLEVSDVVGDLKTSADKAEQLLEMGVDGPSAAALWMRIFEQAAAIGERDRALEALNKALEKDPGSIPARTLQLELILQQDPAAFAASLEAMGEQGLSDLSRGKLYLLVAWAWALKARDISGAKAALSEAALFGVDHGLVARLGRAFAAVLPNDAWFEESTRRLLAAGALPDELPSLWFETLRSRARSSSFPGVLDALQAMSHESATAWLGRVLSVYALQVFPRSESTEQEAPSIPSLAERLQSLAEVEPDAAVARALVLLATIERAREGKTEQAVESLRRLQEEEPGNLLVAVLLSDMLRASGNLAEAFAVLGRAAEQIEDVEVSTALSFEAGFLAWRNGSRAEALELWHRALEVSPEAGAVVLAWASLAFSPNELESRRSVLEWQEVAEVDSRFVSLERIAVESSEGGDPEAVSSALESLAAEGGPVLSTVGSLGQLISPDDYDAPAVRDRAFAAVESLGDGAAAVVAAERARLARTLDQDPEAACDYARQWSAKSDEVAPVLEWMAAALRSDDPDSETLAWQTLAGRLDQSLVSPLASHMLLLELLRSPAGHHPALVDEKSGPVGLMNLEASPAGADPRRRARALQGLGEAFGTDVAKDAAALSGWSLLAQRQYRQAAEVFRAAVDDNPDDMACWEGLRTAALGLEDRATEAEACDRLGDLSEDDARAAEFYERAGLLWLDGLDEERGEKALAKGFARDGHRFVTFDKLFRRVRARNENDYLLRLIERRLQFAEDTEEIAKMFWERARVLRAKGDMDAAMEALENVTMLEPDHVGALALSGEVYIRKGNFELAVDMFERLAQHKEAPKQQRLVSGMAAVDLCENQLGDRQRALRILWGLHQSGLSTSAVRERIARLAPALGAWGEATEVLERLMNERKSSSGRAEAARLAMVIHRDHLRDAAGAFPAIQKLLEEIPGDREALDTLLSHPEIGDRQTRDRLLARGRAALVSAVSPSAIDVESVALLSRIAQEQQDNRLRQATLGVLVALGRGNEKIFAEQEQLDKRVARTPQVALDERFMAAMVHPRDVGPISDLFTVLGPVITDALGPTLNALGVGRKDRVDPRDGLPLRNEIAHWAGALGFEEFQLYVGGNNPTGVTGVPGNPPALVVGNKVTAPLSAGFRQAVARELFAVRRGISIIRSRDDITVASIAVAVCNIMGVAMNTPQYATLKEVQRLMSKAMPRKLKKVLPEICTAVANSGVDPVAWVHAALRSLDRMAAIAAGDVSWVLADNLGVSRNQLSSVVVENDRALELIAFVLSDQYLELRNQLGMGVR